MSNLKFFIWIIAPVALYLAYLAWGLPHIAFNYTYQNLDGTGHDPFARRHYHWCEYIGPYGAHEYRPVDGKCPWFRFYKKSEASNAA